MSLKPTDFLDRLGREEAQALAGFVKRFALGSGLEGSISLPARTLIRTVAAGQDVLPDGANVARCTPAEAVAAAAILTWFSRGADAATGQNAADLAYWLWVNVLDAYAQADPNFEPRILNAATEGLRRQAARINKRRREAGRTDLVQISTAVERSFWDVASFMFLHLFERPATSQGMRYDPAICRLLLPDVPGLSRTLIVAAREACLRRCVGESYFIPVFGEDPEGLRAPSPALDPAPVLEVLRDVFSTLSPSDRERLVLRSLEDRKLIKAGTLNASEQNEEMPLVSETTVNKRVYHAFNRFKKALQAHPDFSEVLVPSVDGLPFRYRNARDLAVDVTTGLPLSHEGVRETEASRSPLARRLYELMYAPPAGTKQLLQSDQRRLERLAAALDASSDARALREAEEAVVKVLTSALTSVDPLPITDKLERELRADAVEALREATRFRR
ncbi:MAG: hypothetical protein AAF752_10570 [Bacteroidota bacterium]